MDWISLSQHRYRWRAVVNVVMNLRVPTCFGGLLAVFRGLASFSTCAGYLPTYVTGILHI